VAAQDNSKLQVDPVAMAGFAQSLSGAAESLQARLDELNVGVGEMLGGWQGRAGGAFSTIWEHWHQGAAQVQSALTVLTQLVQRAGVEFERSETANAAVMRTVDSG
jgi:WXG100 family type VII secretion target